MEELDKLNLCFEDPKSLEFMCCQLVSAMDEFKHLITSGAIPNKEDPLYKAFFDLAADCCEFKNTFTYYSKKIR